MQEVYVGVDVRKAQLDMMIRPTGENFSVSNDTKGIREAVKKFKAYRVVGVVVEATGGYERAWVSSLVTHQIPIAVVNPRQARDFARALGRFAKTDRIDAAVLAHFAEGMKPAPYVPAPKILQELELLVNRRKQLVDIRSSEKCILQPMDTSFRASVQKHIRWLDTEIRSLDGRIQTLVDSDPPLKRKRERLATLKGVGPQVSCALLVHLPELGTLDRRKMAALCGLAPFHRDSGGMRGMRHCIGGRSKVRAALYMATIVAIRYNPRIRAHYQRLKARGKASMIAVVACMRKLLTILNAMLAHGKDFSLLEKTLAS
jgi:transposase